MKKINVIVFLIASLNFNSSTLSASENESPEVQENAPESNADTTKPPSRGKGKLLAGILTVSIGTPVGGAVMFISLMSAVMGARDAGWGIGAGLLISVTSLSVGIPLIVSGTRDRTRYKQWEKEHGGTKIPPHEQSSQSSQSFQNLSTPGNYLSIGPTENGGLSLGLTRAF